VRRHLPTCARCRAAVVASAAGVRGPGDTVLLKRSSEPTRWGAALKVSSVVVSLLVAGAAWRYGAPAASSQPAPTPAFAQPTPTTSLSDQPASVEPASAQPAQATPAFARPLAATPASTAPESPASTTVQVVAPLEPAQAVPQVEARLIEPTPQVEVRPFGEQVTEVAAPPPPSEPAATAAPRTRRPPAKKPPRSSPPPKHSDAPFLAEDTDRFGLEW